MADGENPEECLINGSHSYLGEKGLLPVVGEPGYARGVSPFIPDPSGIPQQAVEPAG